MMPAARSPGGDHAAKPASAVSAAKGVAASLPVLAALCFGSAGTHHVAAAHAEALSGVDDQPGRDTAAAGFGNAGCRDGSPPEAAVTAQPGDAPRRAEHPCGAAASAGGRSARLLKPLAARFSPEAAGPVPARAAHESGQDLVLVLGVAPMAFALAPLSTNRLSAPVDASTPLPWARARAPAAGPWRLDGQTAGQPAAVRWLQPWLRRARAFAVTGAPAVMHYPSPASPPVFRYLVRSNLPAMGRARSPAQTEAQAGASARRAVRWRRRFLRLRYARVRLQ